MLIEDEELRLSLTGELDSADSSASLAHEHEAIGQVHIGKAIRARAAEELDVAAFALTHSFQVLL